MEMRECMSGRVCAVHEVEARCMREFMRMRAEGLEFMRERAVEGL